MLFRSVDGSAQTVLLSEVRCGSVLSPGDARGTWALGFPACSALAGTVIEQMRGPNQTGAGDDNVQYCVDAPNDGMGCFILKNSTTQGQARGQHIGGINVTFCDASTRFVRNDVPAPVWFRMTSAADGKVWVYD